MSSTRTLAERCRPIELLVLDVDGVLTEGGIVYGPEGEWKQFHVRDGSGLVAWRQVGKQTALLTGRRSKAVEVRAAELGVVAFQGVADKGAAYDRLLADMGVGSERVACVGDDAADVALFRRCGLAVAVADACPEALAAAHHVTLRGGGRGAVREVIERILRCQGRWLGS
jgi:3-deoxy-D-manno-octulosonate 8-phosphate phosphatase (KDO 8-P phosphatase)